MMNSMNTMNTFNSSLRRFVAILGLAGGLSLAATAHAQSYAMFPKDALPMIQRSVLPADTEGRMGEIGYDPVSQCMYFAAHGANALYVLDPPGMNTIQSIKDVSEPNGIAIAKDLRRLFLTCGDGSVKFYSIDEAKGPAPVPGQKPTADYEPAGKLTLIKSFSLAGEADGVRYDPTMKHLYVAHGKFVSWIDPTSFGAPVAAANANVEANPADAWWNAIGADATELYRLSQQKASPDEIRKLTATLLKHATSEPAAAAKPAGASGGEAKFVRLEMPGPVKGIAVSPDGTHLYANIPSLSQVVVIDTGKWAIDSTWTLKDAGGNYPITTDDTGNLLFVGCRQPSAVLILDANNGSEKGRYTIENDDATDIWWDAHGRRIYVSAGNGNGTVSMIREQNGNWATEHNIPTAPGARTSILIPERGRFLVTAPKITYPPFVFIYLIPGPGEHHDYIPAEH
jgi:DNA-binding beta-propeller fold protein YncE